MFIQTSDIEVGLETVIVTSSLTSSFRIVAAENFLSSIQQFCSENPHRCSDIEILSDYALAECWIKDDGLAGFAITHKGELSNLFSRVGGHGSEALKFAQAKYDRLSLNCFDSLESFYIRHGFEVLKREKNWDDTPERILPSVVYMSWENK